MANSCMNIGCNKPREKLEMASYCKSCKTASEEPVQIPIDFNTTASMMKSMDDLYTSNAANTLKDHLDVGEPKHSHYFRSVVGIDHIDIYRTLALFNVTNPCLQHITKKAMCAGKRGLKDFRQDLQEIIDTANRAMDMLDEDEDLPHVE